MKRGDFFIAKFPHANGATAKSRPVLNIQGDFYEIAL
jgi:hypothetical protein